MSDEPVKLSNPPTPESIEVRLARARKKVEEGFKAFHKILKNKTLERNKSTAQKNTEKSCVDELVKSCVELSSISNMEGVVSILVIALKECLIMKDIVNENEYSVAVIRKQVLELMKDKEERDKKKPNEK